MRKLIFIIGTMLSLLLASCAASNSPAAPTVKSDTWYPVSGYVDGDTFKIDTGSGHATIRMLYIDTPETKKANTPVEPFGPEASQLTAQLLEDSVEVRLSFDKEIKDRFNRTLAIVELKDGGILNELLLQEGLAKVMIIEPNTKMENVYKQLEQEAKQNKLGIWSTGTETSQSDLPVRKAQQIGIELEVDKQAEIVTITNTTPQSIDLDGWKLISVRGNQTYTFEPYVLNAKESLILASGEDAVAKEGVLLWEVNNVWNNNESDPAELYNDKNELVALWEDE
ncbi:thermonuclease family protein [Paenibacillus sp. CAU 1782]